LLHVDLGGAGRFVRPLFELGLSLGRLDLAAEQVELVSSILSLAPREDQAA
jgi:hypothetical protein